MSEHALRREMADLCRRLYDRFYLVATDGNVSARLDDGRLLVTPSGANKGFLGPGDLIVTDLDGNRLTGAGKPAVGGRVGSASVPILGREAAKPSSELAMHVRAYRERPDVRGIVHAHPAAATAFACAGLALDECLLTEAVVGLGQVPLARFALPSTSQVPDSIGELIRQTDVVMLANHGVLAVGVSVMDAYNKMEGVEQFAKVALMTRLLGGPRLLTRDEVARLEALRARYGLTGRQMNCSRWAEGAPADQGPGRTGACSGNCACSRGDATGPAAGSPSADSAATADLIDEIAARVLAALGAPGRRG